MQVLRNCRSISKQGFPFRSMVATGGFRQKTQLESLKQDLDVLIATPGRFMYLIKEGFLQLTNIRWHVFSFLSLVMMLSFIGFARVLLYTVSLLYVLECFFKKVYSNTRFCSSFLYHCCYEYLCYLKSSRTFVHLDLVVTLGNFILGRNHGRFSFLVGHLETYPYTTWVHKCG